MIQIPKYIDKRIRRPIPLNSNVVPGSTPVVSFGDALSAKVATLGLNPSRAEFLDRGGNELVEHERRLATHRSLGTSDLAGASAAVVSEVFDKCRSYFSRNPYMNWFGRLEQILNALGASYHDGSACHLDLVQWATDPTWGTLTTSCKKSLLREDAAFLETQLLHENIELLLVNGRGALEELRRTLKLSLSELEPISGLSDQPARIFAGKIFDRIDVVAWSTNLQSSFGVKVELRSAIADRVLELIYYHD